MNIFQSKKKIRELDSIAKLCLANFYNYMLIISHQDSLLSISLLGKSSKRLRVNATGMSNG